jgi:NADH dehydrogenase
MSTDSRPRVGQRKVVVVIGAGFAGLRTAKRLAGVPGVYVLLIDQRNHHLFQPLLYQVASAGLSPADIAAPIRAEFRHADNVTVHLGRIAGVHLADRYVYGGGHEIAYDYLVIATGAQHSYFGRDEWEPFAPGLKTLEQAIEIRRRLLSAFELAENERDPERQRAALTFVVVGGGPTGVELAGAIADISRTVMTAEFRRIDPRAARVLLLEAGPRLLAAFPEELSVRARRDLERLGVEVRTGASVERIDASGVQVGGARIAARSVFWGAGVRAARPELTPAVATDRAGRVIVGPDCALPTHPEVFVVGDVASLTLPDGRALPGVAPAAMQTGGHAAEMIVRDLTGRPRTPFRYRDRGLMATIGKHRAVAQSGGLRLTGYVAWVAWLLVHVHQLIGFRNRLAVLHQWAWGYLFSKRSARLITERDWMLRN